MDDDVKVRKIEYPDKNGGINLALGHPAFAILAQECVKLFKEQGVVNYCEWRLNSADPAFGTFTVVIQREAGETPSQQNGRLRAELRRSAEQNGECRKLLEKLLEFGENAGTWRGEKDWSSWDMTPAEDAKLDKLWDEVRALLSRLETRDSAPICTCWPSGPLCDTCIAGQTTTQRKGG